MAHERKDKTVLIKPLGECSEQARIQNEIRQLPNNKPYMKYWMSTKSETETYQVTHFHQKIYGVV